MGGAVQPASLTDVFRSTRDSVDYGWSKQQYAWKEWKNWSFDDQFCRGVLQKNLKR